GTPLVLVLAYGRRGEPHLGPDQPPRAAVDPPRRDPRGVPRPARPAPLTRLQAATDSFEEAATQVGSTGLHVGSNVKSPLPSGTNDSNRFKRTGLVRAFVCPPAVACPAGVSIVSSSPELA